MTVTQSENLKHPSIPCSRVLSLPWCRLIVLLRTADGPATRALGVLGADVPFELLERLAVSTKHGRVGAVRSLAVSGAAAAVLCFCVGAHVDDEFWSSLIGVGGVSIVVAVVSVKRVLVYYE